PSVVPPGTLPDGIALEFNTRVAVFAAVLAGLAGVLAGIAPAWHAARAPLADVLASSGRSLTPTGRLRRALTIGEVAGAVLLLSGASLLVRTLITMSTEDHGFNADAVLTMGVSLPMNRYGSETQVRAYYR